ncbi:hypothetical protein UCRPC4_g00150 [Phaeomoniella chlamydospora]|uniref:Uncharacterized protein n=1 Tax=Phaeomoniella chlamydospora TaxID=158046 RepID=A0A0G2H1A4_PHACM|nr:hypothetical protein UCRPC4_g00150 [Phaeomoniella chlamydospora]
MRDAAQSYIVLRGRVVAGTVHPLDPGSEIDDRPYKRLSRPIRISTGEGEAELTVMLDSFTTNMTDSQASYRLLLLGVLPGDASSLRSAGLLLRPIPGRQDSYERVGFFACKDRAGSKALGVRYCWTEAIRNAHETFESDPQMDPAEIDETNVGVGQDLRDTEGNDIRVSLSLQHEEENEYGKIFRPLEDKEDLSQIVDDAIPGNFSEIAGWIGAPGKRGETAWIPKDLMSTIRLY